ncbi:MAG: hypothetical protein JW928_08795 [Candidatus Aureabacteria bacterium]|nr:hypothetical protein [Candidatus Auribacterota bacterium]
MLRNGFRVLAGLAVLAFLFVTGVETGHLTPYIFKRQVDRFCEDLRKTDCRKFFISRMRGGFVWGLSFLQTDFRWNDQDKDILLKIPLLKTDFFWVDLWERGPKRLDLTFFHPEVTIQTKEETLDDTFFKGFLIPYIRSMEMPLEQFLRKIPLNISFCDFVSGRVVMRNVKNDKIILSDITGRYIRDQTGIRPGGDSATEELAFRASFLEKDIFFFSKRKGKSEDIFSIVQDAFFKKDLIVSVHHGSEKASDTRLFLEDFFLLRGDVVYREDGSFFSRGEIDPADIFWTKVQERIFWDLLKDVDPNDYETAFTISGKEGLVKLHLFFNQKEGDKYCFITLEFKSLEAIHFQLDLSGILFVEGEFRPFQETCEVRMDIKDMDLSRLMEMAGYRSESEIDGSVQGEIRFSGPLDKLTVGGEIHVGQGQIEEMDFQKAVFKISGTGRFIFLEDSKFIRESGDIPVVGYIDTGIPNPLRNVKVKPRNSLVWSGINFIRDVDGKTYLLEKKLSESLKVKLKRKFGDEHNVLENDEMDLEIEVELDDLNKFLYKQDEDDSFIGIERTIKF